jgi:hypothetical protein
MRRCVIRIGPIFDGEPWLPEGATYWQRGSLKPLPNRTEIPVVIDHDPDRIIGSVDEIIEWNGDADGVWLAARCWIDGSDWPRKGTGASVSYRTLRQQQIGAGQRILEAILDEVTVTLEQTPVQPGARVVLVREIAAPPRPPAPTPTHRQPLIRRDHSGVILGIR